MKGIYLGDFTDQAEVESKFGVALAPDTKILFAQYDFDQYDGEGSAWVIFSVMGKLYEVHASHDSCNGLEGQWTPEDTSEELILFRLNSGGHSRFHGDSVKKALQETALPFFSLEDLPTPSQLHSLLSYQKALDKKEFLVQQDETIKDVQKSLVAMIKNGVLERIPSITLEQPLFINPLLQQLPDNKQQQVQAGIIDLFMPTKNMLDSKEWENVMSIKNNNIVFEVKIPSFIYGEDVKKGKTKRLL